MRRIWGEEGGSGLGSADALLGDARLSVPARGLAVYLLLLPDGARPDPGALGARPGESPESIAGYLAELETAGYLTRARRHEGGHTVEEIRLTANPSAAARGRVLRWSADPPAEG
ncbi:hypothetical protein [Streptomyces sp. SID3343]|uniref:hypothetical protein n=1 Tax=Streptomyces sp. SID3343 TaxID=2690260 RepID=UPI00136FAD25|nr:hypothetical protein [Streptomyces sp. SID3343]MYW03232.1 hypothetical protein [Streptomyces sp. SID3343]